MNEINELIKIWGNFCKKREFKLNEDKSVVKMLAKGVLENEKRLGLKYCPCRITVGKKEEDYLLICPCNFLIQEKWVKNNQCWCSLFVRR